MTNSDWYCTHQSIRLLNDQDCFVEILPKPDSCISSRCTTTHDENVDLVCLRIGADSRQSGTQKDAVSQSHGELGVESLSVGGIISGRMPGCTQRLYMYLPPVSLPSFVVFRSRRAHDDHVG